MPNTLVSEDGRWWWDGKQWQPMPVPKPPLFPSQPTWLIIGLLIAMPPIGLLMLWTHKTWPLWLKIVLTAVWAVVAFFWWLYH